MAELKAIKLPLFDGNIRKRISATGGLGSKLSPECVGFADVLMTYTKPKLLEDSESDPKYQDETNQLDVAKAYKKNAVAVAQFTMAFSNENEDCMGFVFRSMTSEWPNGNTWLIVERLYKKYRPDDLTVWFRSS